MNSFFAFCPSFEGRKRTSIPSPGLKRRQRGRQTEGDGIIILFFAVKKGGKRRNMQEMPREEDILHCKEKADVIR